MTKTKIVKVDPLYPNIDILRQAADILASGGLVIIPTETVYGIAANMADAKAVKRLCAIKARPVDKPFSLLIDTKESVEGLASNIPISAYKLIDKFWPGPLTIVLNSKLGKTIGMRMPDNEVALKVISLADVPVACPSANISGKPAPRNFQEAIADLDGLVDLAIDAGPCGLGQESSVVDLSQGKIEILRQAAINKEQIDSVVNKKNILFVCTGNSCRSVMAEALLKKKLKERNRSDVEVSSAGIMLGSGFGASLQTQEILKTEGIDVSTHRSQGLNPAIIRKSDLILVMERSHEQRILQLAPDAKNRVFLLKEFAKIKGNNLDIEDPIGRPIEFYAQTLTMIKEAVDKIVELI